MRSRQNGQHQPTAAGVRISRFADKFMTRNKKVETGVLSHSGNHYAVVNGFVYHLRAFGREDQARMFAACIGGNPVFKPEYGWQHISKFQHRKNYE